MTNLQLILLSALQGLTEFLPVSSSGHLILFSKFTTFPDQGLALDVAVHVGSIVAVMIYFWKEIGRMSVVPFLLCVSALWLMRDTVWENWLQLGLAIGMYALVYLPLFSLFSMNQAERNLFLAPIRKIRSLAYDRN